MDERILFKIISSFKVLSFLVTSDGLPENECLELFQALNKKNISLDRLYWAQILRSLSPLIQFTNNNNLKLVKLAHKRLNKVKIIE